MDEQSNKDASHKQGGWTPGPWVPEISVDEWGLSVIASDEPNYISNPTRGQVCHVSVVAGASGDNPDLARANARLIAAAPDLLEALIEALPYVESCEYDSGYKPGAVAKVVRNMNAAILKARATSKPKEGETPSSEANRGGAG